MTWFRSSLGTRSPRVTPRPAIFCGLPPLTSASSRSRQGGGGRKKRDKNENKKKGHHGPLYRVTRRIAIILTRPFVQITAIVEVDCALEILRQRTYEQYIAGRLKNLSDEREKKQENYNRAWHSWIRWMVAKYFDHRAGHRPFGTGKTHLRTITPCNRGTNPLPRSCHNLLLPWNDALQPFTRNFPF